MAVAQLNRRPAWKRSVNLSLPPTLKASAREGRTLEDVLSGAWEDLTAHRAATCPICDGAMVPRYGSGPSAVGGRCGECRTELL